VSLEAFLTGFFNEKANIISKRKDEGEKYFNDQAARAKRIYQEQIGQRREQVSKLSQAANRLLYTANMPEHIVRGLITAGPSAINTALELFEQVPQHEWSAGDWEDIYSTSQFYAQEYDEDLPTFLQRTVGLIGENYRATQETGGDLQSAFMASALGYDAKDRARNRLDQMEVAPGFSASDVLAMEGRPLTQSDPNSTYAGPVPRALAGIGAQNQPPMSADDQWKWRDRFTKLEESYIDDLAGQIYQREMEMAMSSDGSGVLPNLDAIKASPQVRQQARIAAGLEFRQSVPNDVVAGLEFFAPIDMQIQDVMQRQRQMQEGQTIATEAVDAVTSIPMPTPAEDVDEPVAPVSEPPMAPPPPGSQAAMTQAARERFGPRRDPSQPYWAEGQDNAISRGMSAIKGALSGLMPDRSQRFDVREGVNVDMSAGNPPSTPPAAQDTGQLPRGWTMDSRNTIITDRGRPVQIVGVDASGNWVYRDRETGEELSPPN
jgi:hypothetical protein